MLDTEILVVGGGIAGASAAYHLALHGRRVVLAERGEIASGASGVNAGAIDSIGWGDTPDLQAHLTAGSVELFKAVQLDEGEDIEFRQSGALQAIHTAAQYEFERRRVEALRARGHQVNRGHAAEALPFLAGLPAARIWAGLMPFPRDGKPLIGRIPHRAALWIVSGLASSGFGRGPMAGKLLADYLHTGTPSPVLASADPAGRVRDSGR